MRIPEWLSPSNPCRQFGDNERLFEALKKLDNTAILCVQTKAMPSARKFAQQYGLPPHAADEVLNRGTLVFLRKIETGAYRFQGHAPSSYLVEIVRREALMMTRSQRKSQTSVPGEYEP